VSAEQLCVVLWCLFKLGWESVFGLMTLSQCVRVCVCSVCMCCGMVERSALSVSQLVKWVVWSVTAVRQSVRFQSSQVRASEGSECSVLAMGKLVIHSGQ